MPGLAGKNACATKLLRHLLELVGDSGNQCILFGSIERRLGVWLLGTHGFSQAMLSIAAKRRRAIR
jgi:hypothetical protein